MNTELNKSSLLIKDRMKKIVLFPQFGILIVFIALILIVGFLSRRIFAMGVSTLAIIWGFTARMTYLAFKATSSFVPHSQPISDTKV